MEFECPKCGNWLDVGEYQIHVDCPECQTGFIVDHDAEFRDGSWHDLTKLVEHPTPKNLDL